MHSWRISLFLSTCTSLVFSCSSRRSADLYCRSAVRPRLTRKGRGPSDRSALRPLCHQSMAGQIHGHHVRGGLGIQPCRRVVVLDAKLLLSHDYTQVAIIRRIVVAAELADRE